MSHRFEIDGGPTVLVDGGGVAPVSAVYLWLRVGAASESAGMEGAAHLLEHMLFKGAGEHGVGDAASRIEALGGDVNAYTTYEQTVLHATVPAGREAESASLLVEMALHPHIDPEELALEQAVVVEEIRGAADDPGQRLADRLRAEAYRDHPYGRPVLGSAESVLAMTPAALREFHRRRYVGANAILSVAGPVDPAEVEALARRVLTGGEPAPVRTRRRPPGRPDRPVVFALDEDFSETLVEVAFAIPGLGDSDAAALDLLSVGLGGGDASLLGRELRHERNLADEAWCMLENERDGGLLVAGLSPREGRGPAAVGAMVEILRRVAAEGLPAADLRRARTSVLSARLYDRETVDGRAHRAAWYQAFFGDPAADRAYEAAVRAVTAADIRRVARQWLDLGRAVVGAVAPVSSLGEADLRRALESAAPSRAAPTGPRRPPISRTVLENGLRILVEPDDDSEIVAITVAGLGGRLHEGRRNAGLAAGWADAVQAGAGDRDAVELAAEVEARAGGIDAWSSRNSSGLGAVFPASELPLAVSLLADLLRAPRFDETEVGRVRDDLESARREAADQALGLAWDTAWAALYPGHPWGRPAYGTPAGVARITPGRLLSWHRRFAVGSNLVIGVSGGVDPEEVVQRMRHTLGGLPTGRPLLPAPPVLPDHFRRRRRLRLPRQQAHVVVGFPGLGWLHPDNPTQAVLEGVLGGQGGRLFGELREERGLAYNVAAAAESGIGGGAFLCSVSTDPERLSEARRALWGVLADLVAEPLDPGELDRVKAYLLGGADAGLQRARSRAGHLAAAERYADEGLTYRERLHRAAAVTEDQVRDLAVRTLRPDRSVVVAVEPDA